MNQKSHQLLLHSFDEELTLEEQERLTMALQQSSALRIEKDKLEKAAQLLQELDKPMIPFFSAKVMTKIEQLVEKPIFDINKALHQLFPRFAFASCLLMAVIIGSVYFSEGALSINAMAGLTDTSGELLVMDYWEVVGEE